MAEISWAEKVLVSPRYSTWILGWPLSSTTLKGQDSMSFLTVGSSKRRPIRRLDAALTDGTDGFAAAAERQPPKRQDSLGIEDGVAGVHGSIVLSGLTDQTLLVGEGDERGGGERTLLVGNDLDIAALVGSNTRVGSTCARKKTPKVSPHPRMLLRGKCRRRAAAEDGSGRSSQRCDAETMMMMMMTYPDQCQWHRRTLRPPF